MAQNVPVEYARKPGFFTPLFATVAQNANGAIVPVEYTIGKDSFFPTNSTIAVATGQVSVEYTPATGTFFPVNEAVRSS